jgi:hypothetical protein
VSKIYLGFLALFLMSCEGMKVFTVTVFSNETEQAISEADVYFYDRRGNTIDSTKTDSLGHVIFDSGFTGMMFGGPKFRYRIIKEGFITIEGKDKWPETSMKMVKKVVPPKN